MVIVGMHMGRREEARTESEKNILDRDLDEFGKLSLEVRTVLENRDLMCYLCQKARKTGYLSHGERLSRPQRDLSIRFPRSRSAVLNCGNSTVRLRRRLAVPAILKEPKIVILHRFSMRWSRLILRMDRLPSQPAGHCPRKKSSQCIRKSMYTEKSRK